MTYAHAEVPVRSRLITSVLTGMTVLALAVPGWSQEAREERLARLTAAVEESLAEYHGPGAALAVVQGDEVIYARGFGFADVENEIPATPGTRFFIGSTTKAFTATLIGMLVDDGIMDWDDPVDEHLPYFTLEVRSDDPEARATIRDILSHRTGFPRMGTLWANGTATPERILEQAALAEPFAPFRARFHYNNVQYLAAGWAAAAAAGNGWDRLISERILEPLGMDDTTPLMRDAIGQDSTARAYSWNDRLETFEATPENPGIDPVAPAGSIGSTAVDMAEWVRFLLNDGMVDGETLISPEALQETWTPQIQIGAGINYGMGWMMRDWQGQRMITHDGGVPGGYSTIVALLPESDFGFVFMTNILQPVLPSVVAGLVPEILLGAGPAPATTTQTLDFGPYLGAYIANFGPFNNETFTVLEEDGRLALDIPSQTTYALNPPDEDGRWQFALTDQIEISFERDDTGNVVGITLYQAGLEFEIPREGVEVVPEIDLAELDRYLGAYSNEEGLTLGLVIQNQRLAIRLPDTQVLDLQPPDDTGRWNTRANAALGVRFEESADGSIAAMDLFRPADLPVLRLVRAEPVVLPTVDEILALRGIGNASLASPATRSRGRVRFPNSAVEGDLVVTTVGDDRIRIDIDLGEFGQSITVVNGERGWSESSSPMQPFMELTGEMFTQTLLEHPAVTFGDWRQYYDSVEVVQSSRVNGRSVYLVRLLSEGLPPKTLAIDSETGDILRDQRVMLLPGGLGQMPVTTLYEDYRDTAEGRTPFRSIETNEATGRTIYETESIEVGVEIDPEAFRFPRPDGD